MTTQSNLLLSSQRAALETAQDISFQMLDATAKLCELNVQTSRTLIAEATQKLTSSLEANGGQVTDSEAAAALEPSSRKMAAYAKHVYEIATQANAGIVAAVQKHALMLAPQLAMQTMTAATQGAPGSSEAFASALTNPFAAALTNSFGAGLANPFGAGLTNPFEAAQKAFQQAVDTVAAPKAAASRGSKAAVA